MASCRPIGSLIVTEPDCIFCRIVRQEIPSALVYEDEHVLAFLDINPVNPGHVLVVPRKHVERLTEADDIVLAAAMHAICRCAAAIVEATQAEGFNVLQNNGSCAGQVVPHLHFHVIPRNARDGFRFGWRQGAYAEGELEQCRRRITAAIQ